MRRGLTASHKYLLPIYFYDALGSSLFDAICELPEYYVTRAETMILKSHAGEIIESFGSPVRLIELGSGSAQKTRLLFDAMDGDVEYVPVDVDRTMHLKVPQNSVPVPGSPNALFLGADLRKSKSILEPAYDDALGVTAAFNLNLLQRINRELGGNFDLKKFTHRAFYDEERGRIEMHLVSREAQRVQIDAYEVAFAEGETIHTENSHKYDDAALARIANDSGFAIEKTWRDERGWFADVLMRMQS